MLREKEKRWMESRRSRFGWREGPEKGKSHSHLPRLPLLLAAGSGLASALAPVALGSPGEAIKPRRAGGAVVPAAPMTFCEG